MSDTDQFYRIAKLPPYVFAVINEMKAKMRAAGKDVVDFGMGNPDGATPQAVIDKLCEAAQQAKNHRYSMSRGIPHLRQEIVKRYQRNYGVELDSETEAIVTIGAKDALAHLLFAIIAPGDVVVSPNPAYPIHQYGVIMAEGEACMLPMPDPATFLQGLEDVYKGPKKPKVILISFPHNPTTTCVDLNFMKEVVRMAQVNGSLIVHDFAYADLGFDGYKPPSILEVPGAKDLAVEIFSMSKSYNMAGWRVGYCLGNKRMIYALSRIKSYLDYGTFQPIQIASIIALRECEANTTEICDMYQERRDVLLEGMAAAGWPCQKPQGSMFLWAPIPEKFRAMGSLEFAKLLMEKALIAVSPGIGFGPLGEGHVRFSFIENAHRTRQAMRELKQFLRTA
ncbi:MAG: alanine transaminase [Acidobacteriia bacterium 12-62-4]|nr:MAG: alanine transaminase [Acidobacteriia bacterium 12-62-4]